LDARFLTNENVSASKYEEDVHRAVVEDPSIYGASWHTNTRPHAPQPSATSIFFHVCVLNHQKYWPAGFTTGCKKKASRQ
jgi:hypothetical protein